MFWNITLLLSIICEIIFLHGEFKKLTISEKGFYFGIICMVISFRKMTMLSIRSMNFAYGYFIDLNVKFWRELMDFKSCIYWFYQR